MMQGKLSASSEQDSIIMQPPQPIKLYPPSAKLEQSQRGLRSQSSGKSYLYNKPLDTKVLPSAQPSPVPLIPSKSSPRRCSKDSRDSKEESKKHERSSSPSLSLSSLECDQSEFNITHIYKMARRHSLDTTALLHEIKPGSTRSKSKLIEKKSPVSTLNEECLGYGEITMGSVQKMLNLINTMLFKDPRHPGPEHFDPSIYSINKDSTFYDIGHGTGKVVMHVALEIVCKSKGIEIN